MLLSTKLGNGGLSGGLRSSWWDAKAKGNSTKQTHLSGDKYTISQTLQTNTKGLTISRLVTQNFLREFKYCSVLRRGGGGLCGGLRTPMRAFPIM